MRALSLLRETAGHATEPSLEAQQRACLDYCARTGLEVGPAFTQTAHGAPGAALDALIEASSDGQRAFTVVVVADLSVLGAHVRDQLRAYGRLLACGLPLRLADGGGPETELVAAWSSRGGDERRRQQVRQGMRRRALRGEVQGRPPYGYHVVERHLQPDDTEAHVVREIFRLAVEENLGVRRITQLLNESGMRTRSGAEWTMTSVRGVLRNAVYTGTYQRLGVIVPRAHPAIVPLERFRAAQQLLERRRTATPVRARHEYLFAGVAHCGACGSPMIGVYRARGPGGSPYVYYQCEARTNRSTCAYHTRRAEDLEAAVHDRLARPRRGAAAAAAPVVSSTSSEPTLDARRAALRRDIERLLDAATLGRITAAQFRDGAATLGRADLAITAAERALLRPATGVARSEATRRRALGVTRRRLLTEWETLGFDERRRLLHEVVADIVVRDSAIEVVLHG